VRERYRTLSGIGEVVYVEKKSRFIGIASPAASEAEAQAFIDSVRERRKDASHNVFAYIVGDGVPAKRYSDDGEPQGTAGVPVLDVVEKNGLSDTAIVVTRYFGGVLLGASGLIRAYGKTASMAVEAAGVACLALAAAMLVLVEYPMLGAIKNEIVTMGYTITDIKYGVDAEVYVTVPDSETDLFCVAITERTAGTAIIERIGSTYINQ
jgi:uncharacterized YigZ family protein